MSSAGSNPSLTMRLIVCSPSVLLRRQVRNMSDNFASKVLSLSPKRVALLALELHERLQKRNDGWPIAIVGAGCRLPGGISTPESFWNALLRGQDAVNRIPDERWAVDELY